MDLHNELKKLGSISAVAKILGVSRSTVRRKLDQERRESFTSFTLPEAVKYEADKVKHFIITSAQDKTELHFDFWNNIQAYAKFLDATILVGGFTYSKSLFVDNDPRVRSKDVWFADELEPYIVHDKIALGDGIVFCAEMNTLPTATQPLSGLETYTKEKWGIFPHAKVQLRSIATMKNALTKQIMTTGCVTLPNYIRRKAGVKAEFHHQIGAVVVTIAPDGAFFCRHIHANSLDDGSFYDLDRFVKNEIVAEGHRVEAIVHGDIHIEKVDPVVASTSWGAIKSGSGETNLTLLLNPKYRVFHDLIDFSSRNHHNIDDHHSRFKAHFNGRNNVKEDLLCAVNFLNNIQDSDIKDIVIQSNHDNALVKWLKNKEARYDPENYEFWLECELKYIKALRKNQNINLFISSLEDLGLNDKIYFVNEESNFSILGVELGIHGHYGANGGKGSPATFTKMGPKSITGHTHSPSITDGHMSVGTNSRLDMGYNVGLSSWSHTNAVLYPNGHRALITMMKGRWFD